jgi:F-type H+-transporting ATPase subunit delta
VTSATKASYALASRYAVALIDLAQDSGNTDQVERDLTELSNMIRDSKDLSLLIRSPSLTRKAQSDALLALADKAGFNKLTKNLFSVLVQNRRLNTLRTIIDAFNEELAKRRGEITVDVQTAQDMSPAQLKSLQESLSKGMGREVSIRAKVEPAIMGGMIVTVGSKMIDDSVRHKLERLKQSMGRQANQNTVAKTAKA